jgi:hypothetical protein
LELLHRGLVGLPPAQEIWAMAVAVLGVASSRSRVLSVSSTAKWIVLVRNVLFKIGRDHVLDLRPLDALAMGVPRPLGEPLVVVTLHQGGVRIGGCRSVD